MISKLKRFRARLKIKDSIIIVSGLPRSGTSMMMAMLEAGGLKLVTDGIRKPDDDNPRGYYEFERVKKLPEGDTQWLKAARGKGVKVISALLRHLPPQYHYKIIFMRRSMPEVLASQEKMLERRGERTANGDNEKLARLFEKHLEDVGKWLAAQRNAEVLYVSYNDVLEAPDSWAEEVNRFVGGFLDVARMRETVDRGLYRNRERTR